MSLSKSTKGKNDTTTVISASHPKLRKATIRYREATVGEPGSVKDAWSTDNNKTENKIWKDKKQRRVWSWLRMNASDRLNTCKSRGSRGGVILPLATGARVSNTYAICPSQRDNREKFRLIPHNTFGGHPAEVKGAIRWRMSMRRIRIYFNCPQAGFL